MLSGLGGTLTEYQRSALLEVAPFWTRKNSAEQLRIIMGEILSCFEYWKVSQADKGGIGKSFVSTLLAQHVINETGAVRCFDTDQENTTFKHYAALAVTHITLTDQSRLIDPKKFDFLMETLLTEEGNFVIDTGANTFSNLLAYMVENEVFGLLRQARKAIYVHTIVGGGDTLADTANGFYAIAQKVSGARIVLWFNEHFR